MSDTPDAPSIIEDQLTFWQAHKFLVLIIATIFISLVLVSISLVIYNTSGSAQLDLSRPGYQSVSDQVDRNTGVSDYSPIGPVNEATVNEFLKLYDEQAAKAKAIDAFNGDPLNPEVLEFGVPASQ